MPQRATLFRGIFWKETSVRKNAESPLPNAARRRGFSLVELLVVVAIIGTLIGLLLPAVQSAREAGRRMSCQNNLRQIGIGFHNFESSRGYFPTTVTVTGGARHYWVAQILPYMEQNPLASIYDYTVAFSDAANREAVQFPLPFISCSSTPGGPIPDPKFKSGASGWGSVGADYAGSRGASSAQWANHVSYPEPTHSDGFFASAIRTVGGKGLGIQSITDGTSKTVAVLESAARPQVWYAGIMVAGSGENVTGSKYVPASGWPNFNAFDVRGYTIDLSQTAQADQYDDPGPQMINGCNYYSCYSFHPGVAGLLFADGSARFLSETTSCDVFAAALTIAGGEMVQTP
jgi:prepilin-type N-terminal cleavage/methylation domain-containing protein